MEIEIREETIDLHHYMELRGAVGWPLPPADAVAAALENSEFSVAVRADGTAAGMGRIVGDRGFVYFIADIVVHPGFQGLGIGSRIMERILGYLRNHAPENAYITLMAAEGKEEFYEKFGFFRRPAAGYGAGMMISPG